jgi:fatty acid desaturase
MTTKDKEKFSDMKQLVLKEYNPHADDNQSMKSVTGIICISVVAVVGIIGAFWGREGYIWVGLVLAFTSAIIVMVTIGSTTNKY